MGLELWWEKWCGRVSVWMWLAAGGNGRVECKLLKSFSLSTRYGFLWAGTCLAPASFNAIARYTLYASGSAPGGGIGEWLLLLVLELWGL